MRWIVSYEFLVVNDMELMGKLYMRRLRAYTLIEMLMVVVIMGILAAVAIPSIGNVLDERYVNAAAMQIKVDLEAARNHAVSTSTSQTLSFNPALDNYSWAGMKDPDRPGTPYSVDLSGDEYNSEFVSLNFGGDSDVVFDMHGMADSNGEIVVKSGSLRRRVELDGVTGEVTVKEN